MTLGDTTLALFHLAAADRHELKAPKSMTGSWRVGIAPAHGDAPVSWQRSGFFTYLEAEKWADRQGLYRNVRIEFQEVRADGTY